MADKAKMTTEKAKNVNKKEQRRLQHNLQELQKLEKGSLEYLNRDLMELRKTLLTARTKELRRLLHSTLAKAELGAAAKRLKETKVAAVKVEGRDADLRSYSVKAQKLNALYQFLLSEAAKHIMADPKPGLVRELDKVKNAHYDQYTDGTMALYMRKLQQVRRETLPPEVGHLRTRKRYINDEPLQPVTSSAASPRPTYISPKIRFPYVHTSGSEQRQAQQRRSDELESTTFTRIRRAEVTDEYCSALRRTKSFLSRSQTPALPKAKLTREETYIMVALRSLAQSRSSSWRQVRASVQKSDVTTAPDNDASTVDEERH